MDQSWEVRQPVFIGITLLVRVGRVPFMLMKHILLLMLALFLLACHNSVTNEFPSIKTVAIDTAEYSQIKDQFGLKEVESASAYLGGLSPRYPIARGYTDCSNCYEKSWQTGGMMCFCRQYIIKRDKTFQLIKTRQDLKALYTPITSREEALSYAVAVTDFFPVLEESFFKNEYRYHRAVSTSRVQEINGYYIVQLFHYVTFGCSHPYSVVLIKVTQSGAIEILRNEIAFEDPAEDALCVD